VHWGEISVLQAPDLYPLHDVTASGINQTWDTLEPNRNRFGPAVMDNNFGLIEADWSRADPAIRLNVIDVNGQRRVQKEFALSELRFPRQKEKRK
jgi:alkaline phosphatase D